MSKNKMESSQVENDHERKLEIMTMIIEIRTMSEQMLHCQQEILTMLNGSTGTRRHQTARRKLFAPGVNVAEARRWLTALALQMRYVSDWYTMYRVCQKMGVLTPEALMIDLARQWKAWTGTDAALKSVKKCSALPAGLRYSDVDRWDDLGDVNPTMKKRIHVKLKLLHETYQQYHVMGN